MREVPDGEGLQASLSLGEQALEHAADHMFPLSEACMTPVKPFAAFTLGRGVLESAAGALWLFDADIESGERVARGISLRHQGLDSQRKLATLPAALNEHTDLALDKIAGRVREMLPNADEEGVEKRLLCTLRLCQSAFVACGGVGKEHLGWPDSCRLRYSQCNKNGNQPFCGATIGIRQASCQAVVAVPATSRSTSDPAQTEDGCGAHLNPAHNAQGSDRP